MRLEQRQLAAPSIYRQGVGDDERPNLGIAGAAGGSGYRSRTERCPAKGAGVTTVVGIAGQGVSGRRLNQDISNHP